MAFNRPVGGLRAISSQPCASPRDQSLHLLIAIISSARRRSTPKSRTGRSSERRFDRWNHYRRAFHNSSGVGVSVRLDRAQRVQVHLSNGQVNGDTARPRYWRPAARYSYGDSDVIPAASIGPPVSRERRHRRPVLCHSCKRCTTHRLRFAWKTTGVTSLTSIMGLGAATNLAATYACLQRFVPSMLVGAHASCRD